MSYYTLLGVIAVPAAAQDPLTYADPDALQFRGSSRSGAFHSACSRLLDRFPGHESLRCLSGFTASRDNLNADGKTDLTLLGNDAIEQMLGELESLLRVLPNSITLLANHILPYHGSLSDTDVAVALENAIVCRELNRDAAASDDGDSPEFFFSVLVSLRALLRKAHEGSQYVVIYSWQPAQSAA